MLLSRVLFSESEAFNHTPSLADFTTNTPELKFSVQTGFVWMILAENQGLLTPEQRALA